PRDGPSTAACSMCTGPTASGRCRRRRPTRNEGKRLRRIPRSRGKVANEHERIMEMLEYLSNELTNRQAWPDKVNPITTIKDAYLREVKEQKDQATLERYQKALADTLPGLTSGIINAAQKFKGGDPFGGSAAIMDICATLASAIGSIAPAGGPPGALVG